jgi:hypothetical protein
MYLSAGTRQPDVARRWPACAGGLGSQGGRRGVNCPSAPGHLQPAESVLLGEHTRVPWLHVGYVHAPHNPLYGSGMLKWRAMHTYPHAAHANPYAIAPITAGLDECQAADLCSISCTY